MYGCPHPHRLPVGSSALIAILPDPVPVRMHQIAVAWLPCWKDKDTAGRTEGSKIAIGGRMHMAADHGVNSPAGEVTGNRGGIDITGQRGRNKAAAAFAGLDAAHHRRDQRKR